MMGHWTQHAYAFKFGIKFISTYHPTNGFHKTDGPYITKDGEYVWALNGYEFEFAEWLRETDQTDEEKVLLKLRYG